MERIKPNAIAWVMLICLLHGGLLQAAPTTQPTTAKAVVTGQSTVAESDTRGDNRENRRYGRERRNRDRVIPVAATPADPYGALNSRSIFVKGNQQITGTSSGTSSSGSNSGGLLRKPEASLVFNGVTVIDGQANAFIEDLTADHVSTVRVGDGISGGKVSAITFDTLSYEANGKVLNVSLGQNLQGNAPGDADVTSTSTPGPTTLPFSSGYIGVGPSGGSTSGMSPEDILARMKAKRQAELNGK